MPEPRQSHAITNPSCNRRQKHLLPSRFFSELLDPILTRCRRTDRCSPPAHPELRAGQHFRFCLVTGERLRHHRLAHRRPPRHCPRLSLLHSRLGAAWRRRPSAHLGMAKGRARVAINRRHRAARHRSRRRLSRSLAAHSQQARRRRRTAPLHTRTTSRVASAQNDRCITRFGWSSQRILRL